MTGGAAPPLKTRAAMLGLLTCLAWPLPATAQPAELARTTVFSRDAILYEDGTWAFADQDVTVAISDLPACLATTDGRVTFCTDDVRWDDRVVFAETDSEQHVYTATKDRISLVAEHNRSYGYADEFAYYVDYAATSDGLLWRLITQAAGLGSFEESAAVYDDIVIFQSSYAEPAENYYTHGVEIMQQDQTLYLEVSSTPALVLINTPVDHDALKDRVADEFVRLFDDVMIDSKSLTEILEAAAQ